MSKLHRKISFAMIAAALLAAGAQAQSWTSAYASSTATGDCAGLPAALNSGFTTTPVVSDARFPAVAPRALLKMTFWLKPGAQFNDIYIAEKGTNGTARVLLYDAVADTLRVIGTLTGISHGGGGVNEQGLLGIALNPVTFGTDNYLYLFYSIGTSPNNSHSGDASVGWRVVRYTLDATTRMMDLASAKVLIHIPAGNNARWHTGGALQFDNYGNLYIATGDNEALAMGPGNTADLRGAVLRIRPDNSERGYSIPANNFGEYWAKRWQDSGLSARATEYLDTSKVKPELYVKGSRNPYTIGLDPNRPGWLRWSECGPDAQRGEEHSFTTTPAFSGWPFWAGNSVRQSSKAGSYNEPNEPGTGTPWTDFNFTGMSTQVPVNNWAQNPGVDTLPPQKTPSWAYTGANGTPEQGNTCAAGGGPIIRYDGRISNPGKMPPHLDNVTLFADYMGSGIWAKQIDTATGATTGTATTGATTVLTMTKTGRPNLNDPVDFQQGADGSLYLIDWARGNNCCPANPGSVANHGIVRVTYTGTCQDPGRYPATVSIRNPGQVLRGHVEWLRVGKAEISLRDDGSGRMEAGSHTISILDLNGRIVHTIKGHGARTHAMPTLEAGKIFVLRAETPIGTAVRTFSSL